MKKDLIIGMGIFAMIIFFATSCLRDLDKKYPKQTYEQEMAALNVYLDSLVAQGYDVDTTDLGVYYVTIEEGEGDFPVVGDSLEVDYTGYLVDGTVFDSSEANQSGGTFKFELGNPEMIPGWDDGMTVINKGAIVELIVPSTLAYGEYGYGPIPPNNTLLFVVKMLNITQAD